jgi:hypothetical protein
MKRLTLFLLLITGCSTAPVADLLDYLSPGKLEQGKVAPYGGVCGPQQAGAGAIVAPAHPLLAGPPLGNPPPQAGALPPPDFSVAPGR